MARIAWVLNLDVELELADPDYRRSARMCRRIEELAPRFLAGFEDEIEPVLPWQPRPLRDVDEGRAWCPTPAALSVLVACGVAQPDAPPESVLLRVLSREFAASLGHGLPGAIFTHDPAEVEAKVAQACDSSRWLLKRSFGFSGRERKLVTRGALDATTRRWVEASVEHGVRVEPWVEIVREFGLHGRIARDGTIELGAPVVQVCDNGAWVDSRRIVGDEIGGNEREQLFAVAIECAGALVSAGFFGPFCVDGYRWRQADGTERFQALGELNARYTMGFATGMVDR